MNFIDAVKNKARQLGKSIVFPETFDNRTLKAIEIVVQEQTAQPILLGKEDEIKKQAQEAGISINWDKVSFVDLEDEKRLERYAHKLHNLRSKKGVTPKEAAKLVRDRNYFSVMMVELNEADGLVTGANVSSSVTYKPALQIIKTKEKFHKVSGVFFMIMENRLLLFADCAINIEPNSHDLADIAIDTAETAQRFGLEPKVAMLSYATNSSSKHPHVQRIKEAVKIVKYRQPELLIEGEIQVDAALVPAVAKYKFPNSVIAGQANILIFPDLEAGNIAYKLVERLAGAKAIGPILQGLNKPVNDLSRGCSASDIADLTAITACEAAELSYEFDSQKPLKSSIS